MLNWFGATIYPIVWTGFSGCQHRYLAPRLTDGRKKEGEDETQEHIEKHLVPSGIGIPLADTGRGDLLKVSNRAHRCSDHPQDASDGE